MTLKEQIQEHWDRLTWFDKLILVGVIIILVGEWQGWWNDVGLLALNVLIIGQLYALRDSLAKIEKGIDHIEQNTRS